MYKLVLHMNQILAMLFKLMYSLITRDVCKYGFPKLKLNQKAKYLTEQNPSCLIGEI